ncbi:MAG: T9SS type B sorting domain-containing protein [Saprospiraceae bacterium]|nr:T9SS type B sorting domain-containing protein [Saprospiraceae bacterium]
MTSSAFEVSPSITTTYTATIYTETNTGNQILLSCPSVVSFTVTVNTIPALNLSAIDPTCNANGSVTASIVSPTGLYDFVWSTSTSDLGVTSSTSSGLSSGTYIVTATGSSTGCSFVDSIVVYPDTSAPSIFLQTSTTATCGQSNGTATVSTNGGVPVLSYLWNDGDTNTSRTGLAGGTYTVTVTDGNSCTSTVSFDITEQNALAINLIDSLNPVCSNSGMIEVEASGGTPTLGYLWNNSATTAIITGLNAGTYTLTVTDANNCTATATYTLTSASTTLTPTANSVLLCSGDTTGIVVNAFFGTAPYSYTWIGGSSSSFATNQDIVTGAIAGTYNVTVTDATGNCTATGSITIAAPPPFSISLDSTDIDCFGDSTGSATVTVSGGSPTINILWNSSGQSTNVISNLQAGNYIVSVTDNNSCLLIDSITVNQPSALIAAMTDSSNIICFGGTDGSATVTPSGGTAAYTYLWSDNQTDSISVGLSGGVYQVTITDANNCSITQQVTISEPTEVTVSITGQNNVTCNGDSNGDATALAGGGTGSLSYLWSSGSQSSTATGLAGGSYTLTVTDGNGCTTTDVVTITEPSAITATILSSSPVTCYGGNDGQATIGGSGGADTVYTFVWSNGQTNASATGLTASAIPYSVTVIDTNLCSVVTTVSITEPAIIQTTTTSTSVSCNGTNDGSADVLASGGTPGFSYLWDVSSNNQTTANATGLASNTYFVTITDTVGCTVIDSVFVSPSIPLDSADVPLDTINGILDCNLNPSGVLGINTAASYAYLWSNGATSQNISGLTANNYSVTITNSSGCTVVQSGSVNAPFVPTTNAFVNIAGQTADTVTPGTSVIVDGGNDQSSSGVIYNWSGAGIVFGDTMAHNTTAVSNITGDYVMMLIAMSTDSSACSATDTLYLSVEAVFSGMPDAFTPNSDGFNDFYFPVGLTVDEIVRFRVFNRWSQEIYNGDILENGGWDGKYRGIEQPSEVYIYLLEYKLGATNSVIMKGEFTLLR